jgi:hypothetical protein
MFKALALVALSLPFAIPAAAATVNGDDAPVVSRLAAASPADCQQAVLPGVDAAFDCTPFDRPSADDRTAARTTTPPEGEVESLSQEAD